MPDDDETQETRDAANTGKVEGIQINTNTYISVGLIALVIGGLFTMQRWLDGQFGLLKDNQTQLRMEFVVQTKDVTNRLSSLEATKNTDRVSWNEWFRWAVKLQRDNPTIKVPEPDPPKNQ